MKRIACVSCLLIFTFYITIAQQSSPFIVMEYGASTNPQSGTWMKPFKSSTLTRFDYGNIQKPYWTFEYRKKNVKAFYIPVNSKNLQGEPAFIAGFKKLGVYEDVKNLPGFHNVVYISPEKKGCFGEDFLSFRQIVYMYAARTYGLQSFYNY